MPRAGAQPYFQATAVISGNSIVYKVTPVNGNITCGWSDIEFFIRNNDNLPNADNAFQNATITVNTNDFPGVTIPYNGLNVQGAEMGYNNYWFGISFVPTAPLTYNQNQEYTVCTIGLSTSPAGFDFEFCHNEPNFTPHYIVLTDEGGNDQTAPSGILKFYGPGAHICEPNNCPPSNPGNNHILPLNGPTPVQLLDFQAEKHDEHTVRLDWSTATEIGFSGFEIERQAVASWEKIGLEPAGALSGAGARYQFFDHNAPYGRLYYRLKMLDFDGSFAYSPIRLAVLEGESGLSLYPNPSTGIVFLKTSDRMPESTLRIELRSLRGKLIFSQTVEIAPGAELPISLEGYFLPESSYLFRATGPGSVVFQQYVVLQRR